MKKILSAIWALTLFCTISCKKDKYDSPKPLLSSVNVINAVTDIGSLLINRYANGFIYSAQKDSLNYQSSKALGIANGTTPFKVVSKNDSARILFAKTLNLKSSGMYSIYITGNTTKSDTLFTVESSYPRFTDSTVAVRVVNLAINGPAVNVSLSSTPDVNDYSNIAYKKQSNFKTYRLTKTDAENSKLSFNIKSAANGAVLTNFTLPQYAFQFPAPPTTETARFKAITLVICGDINAAPFTSSAYSVFAVANY